MPKFSFKAFQDDQGEWCVFADRVKLTDGSIGEPDLSDIDPAKIVVWEFENRPTTVFVDIQAKDLIKSIHLTPGTDGFYNQEAYELVRAMAHMATYCRSWSKSVNGVATESHEMPEKAEQALGVIREMHPAILMGYMKRSTRGANLDEAKKPKPPQIESGGESD